MSLTAEQLTGLAGRAPRNGWSSGPGSRPPNPGRAARGRALSKHTVTEETTVSADLDREQIDLDQTPGQR